jgi:hypothetical protein
MAVIGAMLKAEVLVAGDPTQVAITNIRQVTTATSPAPNSLVAISDSRRTIVVNATGAMPVSLAPTDPTDPNFANVSLLLHMDGSNGSTTFTDSSSNAFTVTPFGNAQISTTDPKFGTGALTLDGSGDYLTLAVNSAFQFGTGDFTVECWVFPNNASANAGLFQIGTGDAAGSLSVNTFNEQWRVTDVGIGGANMTSVTAGAWQHLAVTRSGTSVRMFINGVQAGSTLTWSTNFSQNQLNIGFYFSTSFAIDARIDDFRITKGIARYTANFTPPIAPFPDA